MRLKRSDGSVIAEGASLCCADLRGANLAGADLAGANLDGAKLSGAAGLLSPIDWMRDNFEAISDGYIAFKSVGQTAHTKPDYWAIEPGAILTETVNRIPTNPCGCGASFATRYWISAHYPDATIWRCLIRWAWLPGVVVPYNTDGKARCEKLQLIEQDS